MLLKGVTGSGGVGTLPRCPNCHPHPQAQAQAPPAGKARDHTATGFARPLSLGKPPSPRERQGWGLFRLCHYLLCDFGQATNSSEKWESLWAPSHLGTGRPVAQLPQPGCSVLASAHLPQPLQAALDLLLLRPYCQSLWETRHNRQRLGDSQEPRPLSCPPQWLGQWAGQQGLSALGGRAHPTSCHGGPSFCPLLISQAVLTRVAQAGDNLLDKAGRAGAHACRVANAPARNG